MREREPPDGVNVVSQKRTFVRQVKPNLGEKLLKPAEAKVRALRG